MKAVVPILIVQLAYTINFVSIMNCECEWQGLTKFTSFAEPWSKKSIFLTSLGVESDFFQFEMNKLSRGVQIVRFPICGVAR